MRTISSRFIEFVVIPILPHSPHPFENPGSTTGDMCMWDRASSSREGGGGGTFYPRDLMTFFPHVL